MQQFECVLRVEPRHKSQISGMMAHQMRTQPTLNSDPKRQSLNRVLVGSGDFAQDLQPYFDQFSKSNKNAADFAEVIVTAHREFFNQLAPNWQDGKNLGKIKDWALANVKFMKEKYPDMVASAVLHMDESAPHIHFNIVPIATFTKNFRRGSKEQTKIYYNQHFGDRREVIVEARRKRDPELTKLGRLQTDYANAMAQFGLIRGTKNSRATHRRIDEFYENINKEVLELPPKPSPIPAKTLADKAAEALGQTTENLIKIKRLTAEHKEYERMRSERDAILSDKSRAFDMLAKDVAEMKLTEQSLKEREDIIMTENKQLKSELELSKEEVSRLRGFDIKLVADKLAYTDDLMLANGKPKWRNAIDMVKDVGGMDYKQAVSWLASEFGVNSASQSVVAHAVTEVEANAIKVVADSINATPTKPLTRAQYAITMELEKQLNGLDSELYRITCKNPETGVGFNVGKEKNPDKTEKFYTKDEVLALVPQLQYDNVRRNFDIYLTPISKSKHHILIDDVKKSNLDNVLSNVNPCSIVESSPNNFQIIAKIDATNTDKNAANMAFKHLNSTHGDPKISGLVHPIRAVGFTNRKPKHTRPDGNQPFVRLQAAVSQFCEKTLALATELFNHFNGLKEPETKKAQALTYKEFDFKKPVNLPNSVANLASKHYSYCASTWADTDWSRADYMFVQKARQQGVSDDFIAGAIKAFSPHLDSRHADFDAYLTRTLLAPAPSPKIR